MAQAPKSQIKPRNKTGPKGPSKLTDAVVGKLEAAFVIDATIEEACFYAGINKDTYYAWKKRYPELSDRLEALRNTPVLAARQKVVNGIEADVRNAQWYLERKRGGEFSSKQSIELTINPVSRILDKFGLGEGDDAGEA